MSCDPPLKRAQRLDLQLVARGLAPSRARAQALIRGGLVEVQGALVTRPAAGVPESADISLRGPVDEHVSRGALKLAAAMDHFRFPLNGIVALDVGASTGGFTEVLLAGGAARVYAVDVGHGQLNARLRKEERVICLEGCDARRLDRTRIPEPVDAIVADVSFISLTKVLAAPLALATNKAWLVALIKPQFEAGRAAVGKRGIVRDSAARSQAVELVRGFLAAQAGWRVLGVIASPISGATGNAEFLLGAVRDG
jgi:23S rRNA (cytidine1920-2'-O)/16S rRNA (cytidine1409-2'-O)-methyltransferase